MNGFKQSQYGFSLIEALIAVLVLSIGLIGLAGMQMASLKSVHNSSQKQQATMLLNEMAGHIRNNYVGAKAGVYTNQVANCSAPPTNSCRLTACTPTELAAADLYQVLCGDGGDNVGVKNTLVNGAMTVTCPVNCATALRLGISWSERATTKNEATELTPFELFMEIVVRGR